MIYVLRLEHQKYYVGYCETTDDRRIRQHFDGRGSLWTQMHPPIEVMWTDVDGSVEQENDMTLQLMYDCEMARLSKDPHFALCTYNDVRGGKWTRTFDYQRYPLELEAKMKGQVPDREATCMRCSRRGHTLKTCMWDTDKDGDVLM